jgi:uncharacterized protein (DUF58 family)
LSVRCSDRFLSMNSQEDLKSSDELLERLQFVEIYTRKRIQAHILGDYESSLKGTGFEFREHKKYQRGDDYRRIDCNVTARFQYPYVKQFVAEKEVNVWLVCDLSSSMFFGSGQRSKSEVGFLSFSDQVESCLAPRQSRVVTWDILRLIPHSRSSRRLTCFDDIAETLRKRIKGTSLIFFLSDFISLEQMFENPQMGYLARHHDLIPVVIEDPLERAIPQLPGLHLLEDSESGHRRMSYWSKENVNKYQREIERRKQSLTSMFYSMNLDSLWIDTGDENFVDRLLEHFLRRRRLS